ncbi:VOC family protein [Shimia marina]|uniref:Putative enzyme related to lactoylglutathione lyase n=1 Tax=Shimia marina TaxID=321267 RepID=A0A0P1FAG0_9RHOB|nr:VOC family protein [Shimia marina]CUH50970.1 putative enzyme related to lactoylglutathione lyase [Shimia marina]SFD61339.1 Glyoxalase-like domain-containing protein [Shimia marina]
MIAYVTVGADDILAAERFYSAFLPALGYRLEHYHGDLSYIPPGTPPTSPDFYVKAPFNGAPASAGNGSMVAFQADNQQQVRDLHAAALLAGGADAGAPGFREAYSDNFFVAYLRDPQGNKLALFTTTS